MLKVDFSNATVTDHDRLNCEFSLNLLLATVDSKMPILRAFSFTATNHDN